MKPQHQTVLGVVVAGFLVWNIVDTLVSLAGTIAIGLAVYAVLCVIYTVVRDCLKQSSINARYEREKREREHAAWQARERKREARRAARA